jgi:hypothetical protein
MSGRFGDLYQHHVGPGNQPVTRIAHAGVMRSTKSTISYFWNYLTEGASEIEVETAVTLESSIISR